MLPTVFKTGKKIEFNQLLKSYIVKNYDAECYSKQVQAFLAEFQQNRNVIINLNEINKVYDELKIKKDILITYLNMLNIIKSKMNFGKDLDYAVKIEFTWRDVLKNNNWSSYNINFEYYSSLFNLGVMYYLLGSLPHLGSSEEEVKLKEAIKYYQYSAGIFDMIKNELPGLIPTNETPYDLSSNYLTFCSYISIANGQACLLKVAEKKSSSYELQAELAKGIYDLFNSTSLLVNESLQKFAVEEVKAYLSNRKFFYAGISFLKMKDMTLEEFDKTGEFYGKALVYQGYGVDSLNNGYKDIKQCKNLVDITEYEALLKKETVVGEDMFQKNQRVYFSPTPELQDLPKIEKKMLVIPAIPPEFKKESEGSSPMDVLIPKETRAMIETYKAKMMSFISENLNKYENEATVQSFLHELNLPFSLETILSQNEISESLWKKINDVQQKGGTVFLNNTLISLQKMSEDIERRIGESVQLLKNEEDDDKNMRNYYGLRWVRPPSSELTASYIMTLKDYSWKMSKARKCDVQTQASIMENMKYFELLTLSRESLSSKIPKKADQSQLLNCKEAMGLRKDIDTLDSYAEKANGIINKIFQALNEDNIAPQFLKVLQNKTTESTVLTEKKAQFEEMFKELAKVSEDIKVLKASIKMKNSEFLEVKRASFLPNVENEKFFRELETYAQLFQQKLINLQQGLNFYTLFNKKINEVNIAISDFLLARSIDKNELIKSITTGRTHYPHPAIQSHKPSFTESLWGIIQNPGRYLSPAVYLSPEENPITQMNVVGYRSDSGHTKQKDPPSTKKK